MYFFKVALAAAFFLTAHGVMFTNSASNGFNGPVFGVQYNVSWSDNVGRIQLCLMRGDASELEQVQEIGCGYFLWTPFGSPPGRYVLRIKDLAATNATSDINFSSYFFITNGLEPSVSSQTSSQTQTQAPLTSSSTQDADATSALSPTPSSTSHPKGGLSSTAKTVVGVTTSTTILVVLVCVGIWLRRIKHKKAKGNKPLERMATNKADMTGHQNNPVLTPNETHFAFVAQELPVESGLGCNTFSKTTSNPTTLDHYRHGQVRPKSSSDSSDEESLFKQMNYPMTASSVL